VLLATSLLAACANKPEPPAPVAAPEPVAEAPPAPPPKVPVPRRKPSPPSSPTSATIGTPEPLHPELVLPPAEAPPPPIKLDGLEAAAVEKQLGPPQVQADSPPAVVWRYAAGDCAVDVYLYKDLQSGALRALFVDVKGDDRSDQRREVCLQRLAERHAADAPAPG
jgi:hypothetical protein